VEDDHPVAGPDLVDQVGGPEHGQVLLAAERVHVLDDREPAVDVEADGGLVEDQEAGPWSSARAISTRRL
jgi:hypothetical protein